MMQSEFEKLIGHSVPYEDYRKIEKIYTFSGYLLKEDMIKIFKLGKDIVEKMCADIDYIERENKKSVEELKQKVAMEISLLHTMNDVNNCLSNHIEELKTELQQCKSYIAELERYKILVTDIACMLESTDMKAGV